jgi:methyl-accepting chemotaxis protein
VALGFSIVLLLLVITSVISLVSVNSIGKNIDNVEIVQARMLLVKDIERLISSGLADIRGYIVNGKDSYIYDYNNQFNEALEHEKELLEVTDKGKKADVQKLIDLTNTYNRYVTNDLIPAVKDQPGNTEVVLITGELEQITGQLTDIVKALSEVNEQISQDSIRSAEIEISSVYSTAIVLSILALLLGLGLILYITRSVKNILKALLAESKRLNEAVKEGQLDVRGDVEKVDFEFQGVIQGMNDTLDAVIGPLNVAAEYVDRISKGDIPPQITDSYNGDFNEIKNNLNTCIESISSVWLK